jgi:enamine deaminase RidA (YjgF/YER057c/UK114 family)
MRFHPALLVGSILASGCASAQVRFMDPARGFSHMVVVRGPLIFISGQVAVDATGALVGQGDIVRQTEQVFRNLSAKLELAGASFQDVVKLTVYLTDDAGLAGVRAVRDRFVNTKAPPASTTVIVKRLINPEYLIEIDAVALVSRR